MAHTKITSADLQDKGVVGLPDTPQYTASQMQEKFDEIALDVIVPKFNALSDEIDVNDTEVDNRLDAVEEPVFDEAETRENIESGSALSVLFGKIKKFFSDLKTVAFTGDYDDLTNKPVFPAEGIAVVDDLIHAYPDQALSANMGKELKAMVDSKQDSATAINTSNIASQSVSSATTATKATQDESGNNIKASYAADLTVSGTSVQLKNKNGQTIGSAITVPFATNATNSTNATKATQDGNGNNIANTYLPLSGGVMSGSLTIRDPQYSLPERLVQTSVSSNAIYIQDTADTGKLPISQIYKGIFSGYYKILVKSIGGVWAEALHIRDYLDHDYAPVYASAFNQQSSRKYKENISAMTEEYARKILELNPVSFDYKNGKKDCYGLIAEEVAEIETYPVAYKDGEAEGLDYARFVPQLIKMVQMQQAEIDELKLRL